MSMANRLRRAREDAGYRTAAAAIEHFKWPSSSYRAHENGQNNYGPDVANEYAKAYGVSAAWLLLGDDIKPGATHAKAVKHTHDCIENIQEVVLLLKSDPNNIDLIDMIDACAKSLRAKAEHR